MSTARATKRLAIGGGVGSQAKRKKNVDCKSYLYTILQDSGLTLKDPPEKCIVTQETIIISRNLKKNLQNHIEHSSNVTQFCTQFSNLCQDLEIFKHYLYPNIKSNLGDRSDRYHIYDSVIKILLNVDILQSKIIDFLFTKAIDLATDSKCRIGLDLNGWIQMILKCCSSLDSISNTDKISSHLLNLLASTNENMVRLEIITAIPDIIGHQEHDDISNEISRILSEEDQNLIPAVLDCLSYLPLSDQELEKLQTKALHILISLSKCTYFPNFIKFLLRSGCMSDSSIFESVQGIRNALVWPTSTVSQQDIASSQVLTATALKNAIASSKTITNMWLKVISSCKTCTDHKPIDFVLLIVLYSISDEMQRQVVVLIKKHIKLNILKEDLLDKVFFKFEPIIKDYLQSVLEISNSLLNTQVDPLMVSFASHIYSLVFSHIDNCYKYVVPELLHQGLDRKQCLFNVLLILNNVAAKNINTLKSQSHEMLKLLDKMDDMSLSEIRAVLNLICALAFSYKNSIIRDEIHNMITKELSSSCPNIKMKGIVAGVHAVKYLIDTHVNEDDTSEPTDKSNNFNKHLKEGNLQEAVKIIDLISRSTMRKPDMTAFFYDELSQIIESANYINKHFLEWLTQAVTNSLQEHFIVDCVEKEKIGQLKLSMQYCLNSTTDVDNVIAINIAGLTMEPKDQISIAILSPLFKLVQTLHSRQNEGNLTTIDVLLGCPVIMPEINLDLVEEIDQEDLTKVLDCHVHSINWFRELINAFANQQDNDLKKKTLNRVLKVEFFETLVVEIMMKTKLNYKPPICSFDINKYRCNKIDSYVKKDKQSSKKKSVADETALLNTGKSQLTPKATCGKIKASVTCDIPYRDLSLKLLNLFTCDLSDSSEGDTKLNMKTLIFLLKGVNGNLEIILIPKIKKTTFLTKAEPKAYSPTKAEEYARETSEILPNIMKHLHFATTLIEKHIETCTENKILELIADCLTVVEYIFQMCSIYFKWMGFRNSNNALLKNSLRAIAAEETKDSLAPIDDMVLTVANFLYKKQVICLRLSTAVALIEFLKAIQDYTSNKKVLEILRDTVSNFLSKEWKTVEGSLEKGLFYNQSLDRLSYLYLVNRDDIALKTITLKLTEDVKDLNNRVDRLNSFKCFNTSTFTILYRNLGTSLNQATKTRLSMGLTNGEHLNLWENVTKILRNMTNIVQKKILKNRNNLTAFFNQSLPILKLFIFHGIPILENELKSQTQVILEILEILNHSTRFLHKLCLHSKLNDNFMPNAKVPIMKQHLESLIYKVKAVLTANNCSEAFWMENLNNENIDGEVIGTQQTDSESEKSTDGDSEESDDVIDLDLQSISDTM